MDTVRIRGDGVAAYGCAHLLQSAGFRVSMECPTGRPSRPRLPAIVLSESALHLLRDIFGCQDIFGQKDLFGGQPRIRKRVVAWGSGSKPLTLEHSAVVVSELSLLRDLSAIRPVLTPENDFDTGWTILSSPPLPAHGGEHRFGSRVASAVPVTLKDGSDPAACWIESLERGWLFLIPDAPSSGWLLAVGAPAEPLLGRSRVIAEQISACGASVGEFSAHPRIAARVCAPGWLACGTAAMAFDPLCGDGTAHAIREAILAAAVIRAIAKGGDAEDLLSHYEARMVAAFERHLALCLEFYRTGYGGEWWDSECRSLEQGLDWCRRKIGGHVQFRYRLSGFELEPVHP